MLFAISFSTCYRVGKRTAWILIRLRGCAGWSGSMLVANALCWFCHDVAQICFKFDSWCQIKYWYTIHSVLYAFKAGSWLCPVSVYCDVVEFNIVYVYSPRSLFFVGFFKGPAYLGQKSSGAPLHYFSLISSTGRVEPPHTVN
jgi:hypothetical protein